MSRRSNYKPTVSIRKLRDTTLITEANLERVRGDLKRFFKKQVYKFSGYRPKKVGQEIINYDGGTFTHDIYSKEEYPHYTPYIDGKVEDHSCWKEYLKKGWVGGMTKDEIPRLAIVTTQDASCVPIHIGDRYKIRGNRLILVERYSKYIHNNPYCSSHYLRFREFIHIPEGEVSEKEIFNRKVTSFMSAIAGDLAYSSDEIEYRINDPHGFFGRHLYNVMRDAADMIEADLKNIFTSELLDKIHREYIIDNYEDEDANGETIIIPKILTADFQPKLWIEKGFESGDEVYTFLEGGDKTANIVTAIFNLFKSEIVKHNESTRCYIEDSEESWCDDFGDLDYDD